MDTQRARTKEKRTSMKVRLLRKLSDLINGVDLSRAQAGDTLDLSPRDAFTLIAEGWASPVADTKAGPDRAHDRPRRPGPSGKRR